MRRIFELLVVLLSLLKSSSPALFLGGGKYEKKHEGTIYYSEKQKRYIAQVMIDGVRHTFTGRTEREAYLKMSALDSRSVMTFRSWCIQWMNLYKVHDYKVGTYEKEYRRLIAVLDCCSFADVLICDVSSGDVQQFINDLSSRLSAKTIRNYFILINGAFKQAVNEGLCKSNPCSYCSFPKTKAPDMVALNRHQKDFFLQVASGSPYYDVFVFALNTGMRISEICGLTKDCIDFDNGFIVVKQQLVRLKGRVILDEPKTKNSIRKVPLNFISYQIVKKHYDDSVDDYVFHNPKTHGLLFQNTLSINAHRIFQECYKKVATLYSCQPIFTASGIRSLPYGFCKVAVMICCLRFSVIPTLHLLCESMFSRVTMT